MELDTLFSIMDSCHQFISLIPSQTLNPRISTTIYSKDFEEQLQGKTSIHQKIFAVGLVSVEKNIFMYMHENC